MTNSVLKKIHALLTAPERRRMYRLFAAILIMAFIEVVGVASIMPFMAVLASPEMIETNRWLAWAYQTGAFSSPQAFLIGLGAAVLLLLVFSNSFTALTTRAIIRFTRSLECSLASRLVAEYARRPYLFFVSRNSADLNKNILTEVSQVVSQVIFPSIETTAKIIVSLFMVALLVAVEPMLALVMVVLLGGIYSGLYSGVRHRLSRAGRLRVKSNLERYKVTAELFSGIKDIIVLGREPDYLRRFSQSAKVFAGTQAQHQMISTLPRYALETLVFGGFLLIIIYFLTFRGGVANALPLMGLYAMAGYRIMPAMQYVFRSVTQIRYYLPVVDVLYNDLSAGKDVSADDDDGKTLGFTSRIELNDIGFTYPSAHQAALADVSLTVKKNRSVAFVGATGSGKTTLVDIILGLFDPDSGEIRVDGKMLDKTMMRAWRRAIGYVPQHIFLADDSVERNIALGIPEGKVDRAAVERAAKIANIHEFVAALPKGYDTVIGERGVRLSGGQRQRIGIARALYHDPEILIMDEGTSALDGMTEEAVMQAIDNLAHEKTIILIAHRLTTVRKCDLIYHLEAGRIVASGTYDDLIATSSQFRAMARVGDSMDVAHSGIV